MFIKRIVILILLLLNLCLLKVSEHQCEPDLQNIEELSSELVILSAIKQLQFFLPVYDTLEAALLIEICFSVRVEKLLQKFHHCVIY